MPFTQVMHKFKHGKLHSGSKEGPKVKDRKQALAIMMSEKKKADEGDEEYMDDSEKSSIGPSKKMLSETMKSKGKKSEKKSMFKKRM